MASFKDDKGRSYKTTVNVETVRRVKDLTGVYLPALFDDSFAKFDELAQDVIAFVDVLYSVCKPDIEAQGITPEQFGEALAGDVLEKATLALIEGIVDFFPEARRRALRTYLSKAKAVQKKVLEQGEKALNELDPEKMADEVLAKMNPSLSKPSGSSGSVPESSESTPDHSA